MTRNRRHPWHSSSSSSSSSLAPINLRTSIKVNDRKVFSRLTAEHLATTQDPNGKDVIIYAVQQRAHWALEEAVQWRDGNERINLRAADKNGRCDLYRYFAGGRSE